MSETVHEAVSRSGFVLRLFGGLEVSIDGIPVELKAKKVKWLLALLALRANREVDREWLAGVLWPDSDSTAGRYNLRRALSDLKAYLGNEHKRLHSGASRALLLDLEDSFCDVALFDKAVSKSDTASLEAAAALYRNALLEDCLEDWVYAERLHREQQYLKALGSLAERYLEAGHAVDAARAARLAQQIDPFSDTLQQLAMKALAATGDYAALSVSYRDFRVRLHAEMSLEPATETQEMFRQLRLEAGRKSSPGIARSAEVLEADVGARNSPALYGNLPRPLSSLIGRKNTVEEVGALVRAHPLVTLIGPGGVGKTRIALEVGRELRSYFPDGVWFADLAPLTSEESILPFLIPLFHQKEVPARSLLETLQEFLRPRRLLLVLDNCEHLLPFLPRIAHQLLEHCPTLTLLATSRQALRISGEQLWQVACLDVPPPELMKGLQAEEGSKSWPAMLLEYEAVRLFVERVRELQPQTVWQPAAIGHAASICVALDGLPLAMELAAARAKAMSLAQIATRLQDRFRLLGSGNLAAPARQQTLRALLDWSYNLLTPRERLLLHRLAIFWGGWTLEAAEAICSGAPEFPVVYISGPDPDGVPDGISNEVRDEMLAENECPWKPACDSLEPWEVLDLLLSLVDKSLVIYEEQEGHPRYRLLETVREYAASLLDATENINTVSCRHRDYYLQWVWSTWKMPVGTGVQAIDRDYRNVIAALDFSRADPDSALETMRLAGGLQRFWEVQGYFSEAKRYCHLASEHWGADNYPEALVHTLISRANMARLTCDYADATSLLNRASAMARALSLPDMEADALTILSNLALLQGEIASALAICEQALVISRKHGMDVNIVYLLLMQANIMREQADYTSAHRSCEEAMRLGRDAGQARAEYEGLHTLGLIYFSQQNYAQAQTCYVKALKLYQEIGSRGGEAAVQHSLGDVAYKRSETAKALFHYRQALQLNAEIGYQTGILDCLEGLANLAHDDNALENGALLIGWINQTTLRLRLADRNQDLKRRAEELDLHLGHTAFAELHARGAALTLQEIIEIGFHIAT